MSRKITLKMSKPLPKDRDCWYRYMYVQDKKDLKKDEFLDSRLNVIRCDPLQDIEGNRFYSNRFSPILFIQSQPSSTQSRFIMRGVRFFFFLIFFCRERRDKSLIIYSVQRIVFVVQTWIHIG